MGKPAYVSTPPRLAAALDALVDAVARDRATNKSEFSTATDVLASAWRDGRHDEIRELVGDLLRTDREEYEDLAAEDEDDEWPTPEPPEHRRERWADAYEAPADRAACRVLLVAGDVGWVA